MALWGGWCRRGRGLRGAAEAGSELGVEGVEAGTGADCAEEAVLEEGVFHDVAAECHLGIVGLFGEGAEAGQALADFAMVCEVALGGGETVGDAGGEFGDVLPADDERLAAERFAFVAHFVEGLSLLGREVDEFCTEFGIEERKGGVNFRPIGFRDVECD